VIIKSGGAIIKRRGGYCDLHLDSKLAPALSAMAHLGGDRAWCDPFAYWRCARSECNRCYRADMGYFDLDRKPGDSVRLHAQAQEKCHRHTDLTFDPFV